MCRSLGGRGDAQHSQRPPTWRVGLDDVGRAGVSSSRNSTRVEVLAVGDGQSGVDASATAGFAYACGSGSSKANTPRSARRSREARRGCTVKCSLPSTSTSRSSPSSSRSGLASTRRSVAQIEERRAPWRYDTPRSSDGSRRARTDAWGASLRRGTCRGVDGDVWTRAAPRSERDRTARGSSPSASHSAIWIAADRCASTPRVAEPPRTHQDSRRILRGRTAQAAISPEPTSTGARTSSTDDLVGERGRCSSSCRSTSPQPTDPVDLDADDA